MYKCTVQMIQIFAWVTSMGRNIDEFDGVHGGLRCKSVRRKNVTRVLPGGRI